MVRANGSNKSGPQYKVEEEKSAKRRELARVANLMALETG